MVLKFFCSVPGSSEQQLELIFVQKKTVVTVTRDLKDILSVPARLIGRSQLADRLESHHCREHHAEPASSAMPPSGDLDERKARVVDCVRTLCRCDADEAAVMETAPEVDTFLNDSSCRILQVFRRKGADLSVSNELRSVSREEHSGEVTFMKSSLDDITAENFSQTVIVNSTLQSPLDSLYHAVHSVYAPVLLRDPRWAARMSGAVQDLLTQLDTGLGGLVREGEGGADGQESLGGIVTPTDEFLYWEEVASRRGRGRTRAEKFNSCFDKMRGSFETLKGAKLVELVETIDEAEGVLDEVRKHPDLYDKEKYPQVRHATSLMTSLTRR